MFDAFMAVRLDSHAPTAEVHNEAAKRLNYVEFRVIVFYKEKSR